MALENCSLQREGVGEAQFSAESCLENKECLVLTSAASWKRGLPRMGVWVWGSVVCVNAVSRGVMGRWIWHSHELSKVLF